VDAQSGELSAIKQTMETFPFQASVTLTDQVAAAQKSLYDEDNDFGDTFGGLSQMGAALKEGMVLVLSIWDDSSANMNWLDSCTVATKQSYNCSDNADFSDLDM
jgi:cellulose 1,4-beta-cellobiosidase